MWCLSSRCLLVLSTCICVMPICVCLNAWCLLASCLSTWCFSPLYVSALDYLCDMRNGALPFNFGLMHWQFGKLDFNTEDLHFVIDIPSYLVQYQKWFNSKCNDVVLRMVMNILTMMEIMIPFILFLFPGYQSWNLSCVWYVPLCIFCMCYEWK